MDLIYREKLANKLTALDMPKGIEKEQYFIVMCNVIHALFDVPAVEAVPLEIICKNMEDNRIYPPCENNIQECRDKCELSQKYGVYKQCWEKYLRRMVNEDGSD